MSIYITGDTHGAFNRIRYFCQENHTVKEDILIILGDAGINCYPGMNGALKEDLNRLPITFFCIHGNHEERPFHLPSYEEQPWHGGIVYQEKQYPSLLFAKDGEIYDFDGQKYVVIGGAYSIDKYIRLMRGWPWFASEQPDDTIKAYVEQQLEKAGWKVDGVFSHTTPIDYEPTWAFLRGVDQSKVDKTTEKWLGTIEKKLTYKRWYAGHFHVDSQEGPITLMFEKIERLADSKQKT